MARTDAIAVEGFDAALERAAAYMDAGADVLFIEAPKTQDQLSSITSLFKDKIPLLANIVEGVDTPVQNAAALEYIGFSIAIFPGGIVRALARTAKDYYASLQANGTTGPYSDRMFDFNGLNTVLGTADMLASGMRYSDG